MSDTKRTPEAFALAKIIFDARKRSCYQQMGADILKIECAKFPKNLSVRKYTIPQVDIDIALDQAIAVIGYLQQKEPPHDVD